MINQKSYTLFNMVVRKNLTVNQGQLHSTIFTDQYCILKPLGIPLYWGTKVLVRLLVHQK